MTPASNRHLAYLDLLKAVATQLIVLHHLAFYGPMADHVRPVAPQLIGWLDEHARIAVQVFLVIGGYLAARSMCPAGVSQRGSLAGSVLRRYLKLVPPFLAALVLCVGASAWAGHWMNHASVSATPGAGQFLAHVVLLHNVLGYESPLAGAWYIAIDLQLFALTALLLWICRTLFRKQPVWLVPGLVLAGVGGSLFWFNRDPGWDVWAPYFFGSYGLGMLAWWAGNVHDRRLPAWALTLVGLALTGAALVVDFRGRLAVALVTCCALVVFSRQREFWSRAELSLFHRLGKISYSIFLIHFPVCLLVNAAFNRFVIHEPKLQAVGMAFAWFASLAAGAAFYHLVEAPLGRVLNPAALRLHLLSLHKLSHGSGRDRVAHGNPA